MINNLDKVLADLETKEAKLQADIEKVSGGAIDSKKSELVRIDELIFAIRKVNTTQPFFAPKTLTDNNFKNLFFLRCKKSRTNPKWI